MTEDQDPEDDGAAHYRAFISYSHRDARMGSWIQRRLERYRIPRKLVDRATGNGAVPARLTPIFRDRDELPAAADLTSEVRAALAASSTLIVICSPNSAASVWVAREIALFRELHPDRPILCALIEGEPAESFPADLCVDGREPIAADFRPNADGRRLALLKLVAGITGLGLDALVQRDAQRRVRRVMMITLAAVMAMLAMGLLAMAAISARREADRQRAEAEGLVEFMLTDLRTKLKGVGRLDVMGEVNARALDHYARQPLDSMPPDSIERRARILHAMGEDEEKRGRYDAALSIFREAHRTTAELLAQQPDDADRIFAHAQSEFWIGYIHYQRGRFAIARRSFVGYKRLADRLVRIAPARADYRREAGYAEGNLCSIALVEPVGAPEAVRACREALGQMIAAARRTPRAARAEVLTGVANRHAWLGEALRAAGRKAEGDRQFAAQARLLTRLVAADPNNMELRDSWLTVQISGAERAAKDGRPADARQRLDEALASADRMIAFDPANDLWVRRRARIMKNLTNLAAETSKGTHE